MNKNKKIDGEGKVCKLYNTITSLARKGVRECPCENVNFKKKITD